MRRALAKSRLLIIKVSMEEAAGRIKKRSKKRKGFRADWISFLMAVSLMKCPVTSALVIVQWVIGSRPMTNSQLCTFIFGSNRARCRA